MTAMQHTLALFAGVTCVLVVASLVCFVLERAAAGPSAVLENPGSRPGG